jgi:hypothetical protein
VRATEVGRRDGLGARKGALLEPLGERVRRCQPFAPVLAVDGVDELLDEAQRLGSSLREVIPSQTTPSLLLRWFAS